MYVGNIEKFNEMYVNGFVINKHIKIAIKCNNYFNTHFF